jgi:hypothetical protein
MYLPYTERAIESLVSAVQVRLFRHSSRQPVIPVPKALLSNGGPVLELVRDFLSVTVMKSSCCDKKKADNRKRKVMSSSKCAFGVRLLDIANVPSTWCRLPGLLWPVYMSREV